MSSRDSEALLVNRCVQLATVAGQRAKDVREASLCSLGKAMVRPYFPRAALNLQHASDDYFNSHPRESLLEASELLSQLGLTSLSRLRSTLLHAFEAAP